MSLQHYEHPLAAATSRQLTVVHSPQRSPHEALTMGQTEPSLLNSDFGDATTHESDDMKKHASPSQEAPDLPSWTPLKTLGDEEDNQGFSVSDHELKGPPTGYAQATLKNHPKVTGRTQKSSSVAKEKTVRFDGILITTKPPPRHGKHSSSQTPRPRSARASNTRTLSLVDALARTFDANRHTDGPSRSSSLTYRHDDASETIPQTDVDSITEAEDERLQLNTRLAHVSLKRGLTKAGATTASADPSETNSEDTASLQRDAPERDRPVKRLKPVQYDSNPALIDAALGTVEAPIIWDVELNLLTRREDCISSPAESVHVNSPSARMVVDEDSPTIAGSPRRAYIPPSTPGGNKEHIPAWGASKRAILTPYQSHGAKFRQRLETIFGENATVRKDRAARPRTGDHDFFAALEELDREPSPDTNGLHVSASVALAAKDGASAISSTHITGQSPDVLPAGASMDQVLRNQLNEVDSLTIPIFSSGEEQMNGWITALQRLVKGKVRIKEEDLETLSIILAEIESMKDGLNESTSMTWELLESLKQVSKLHEIPFGDRNKLRHRAESIVHAWPSMEKPGVS